MKPDLKFVRRAKTFYNADYTSPQLKTQCQNFTANNISISSRLPIGDRLWMVVLELFFSAARMFEAGERNANPVDVFDKRQLVHTHAARSSFD